MIKRAERVALLAVAGALLGAAARVQALAFRQGLVPQLLRRWRALPAEQRVPDRALVGFLVEAMRVYLAAEPELRPRYGQLVAASLDDVDRGLTWLRILKGMTALEMRLLDLMAHGPQPFADLEALALATRANAAAVQMALANLERLRLITRVRPTRARRPNGLRFLSDRMSPSPPTPALVVGAEAQAEAIRATPLGQQLISDLSVTADR
jgi:hypothetical protein